MDSNNNKMTNDDLLRYAVGALIVLAFISILGIYLVLFSSGIFKGGAQSAAVFQATEQDPEVESRITDLQKELLAANKRVAELQDTSKNVYANQSYLGTGASAQTPASSASSALKIKTFQADQANVVSGSVVTFTYSSSNTQNGAHYRLLIQCPTGVTATYSSGSSLCRSNIGQALPIDNTGSYSVNFTNTSADSQTSIAVLLAYDMTGNKLTLRDSKVLTVTVRPVGYGGSYGPLQPVTLTRTPATAIAPATISFIATVNNLKTCIPTSWDFGDGYRSSVDSVCPNTNGYAYNTNVGTRQISENHVYNEPGTYTITFRAGEDSVTATVYVGSNSNYTYTQPNYTGQYYNYQYQYPYNYYQQPVYNYVPQPYYVNVPNPQPVYVYQNPSNPAPNSPTLNPVQRSDSQGVTNISWSSSGPNLYYKIFRSTISGEEVNETAPQACTMVSTHSCVIVSGTSDSTYSLQGVDTQYDRALTYFYRVKAYGAGGPSSFSNQVISRPSTVVSNPITDPSLTNFTIGGVTAPTVNSGQSVPLSYGGTNISAYGLLLSCPAGVTAPDQISGSNLCALAQTNPFILSNSGNASITFVNLTNNNQSIGITLVALRTNGSVGNSLARTVVVRPQVLSNPDPIVTPPVIVPPGNVTDLRAVVSGNSINVAWSAPITGGQVIGYDLYRSTNPSVPLNHSATTAFFGLPASARSYVDSSVSRGVVYYYKLFPLGSPANNNGSSNITTGISIPVVVAESPAITNFTINGQTEPTIDSGQVLSLSYGGSFISSYKLLIQCPANVSAPDRQSGAELCRNGQGDAITVSNSGNFSLTLVNLNRSYQTVAITILGLKTDGSVGNSMTRYVTVRNQPGL